MLSYYQKVVRTKILTKMLLSKCTVHNSKTSKFIKEQENKELLSKLTGKSHHF